MWIYEKRLEYPIKIKNPNPAMAKFIISQYGGPHGELGASLRYLSQRAAMPYRDVAGILTDIGTSYSSTVSEASEFLENPDNPSIMYHHLVGISFR